MIVTTSKRHESPDSSASAWLILVVDIDDNGVLVFPMGFQNLSRDKIQKIFIRRNYNYKALR